MSIGDAVVVEVAGKELTGRVKFASSTFVSVDQGGGCFLLLRRDENRNTWVTGKLAAEIKSTETFGERMQRVYDLAVKLMQQNVEDS